MFFIWTYGQEELDSFLEEFNRCNSYLKFTYESIKKILNWAYLTGTFPLVCTSNPQIDTSFYITHRLILIILNVPLFTVRTWGLLGYALRNLTFSNFQLRGYRNKLIEQEMKKVKFFKNGNVVRQRDLKESIPFVLTYHPLFKSMGKIIN